MRKSYEPKSNASPYRELAAYGAAFLLLLGASRGCAEVVETSPENIVEFIENSGFDDPIITDVDKLPNLSVFNGCSIGQHVIKYEFKATSSNTERDFSGIVCDGPFSGKSLRD